MTLQQILEEIPALTIEERKSLVNAIMDSLTETNEPIIQKRTPGLHQGTTWVSDDFDDPLHFD